MPLRKPPLAGRPPFATDEPDEVYRQQRPNQRRQRQEPPPDPNARTSAYDIYDSYLNDDDNTNRNSGIDALGLGFMNGNMDDDDDDESENVAHKRSQKQNQRLPVPKPRTKPSPTVLPSPKTASNPQPRIPLAAPRPGYAAPVAALNKMSQQQPAHAPAQTHYSARDRQQARPPMRINAPPSAVSIPGPVHSPNSPLSVPNSPHPLQVPMTPIVPAFTRPPKAPAPGGNVKFAVSDPIMRGNSEDVLLPKRGDRGDDFWRRFSMVAREANTKPDSMKESSWLKKTQTRSTRLSRLVAVVGIFIFLCIAGAIGLRIYLSHNQSPNQRPTAVGGSADEAFTTTSSSNPTMTSASPTIVTPTNTVARRDAPPTPTSVRFTHRNVHHHH